MICVQIQIQFSNRHLKFNISKTEHLIPLPYKKPFSIPHISEMVSLPQAKPGHYYWFCFPLTHLLAMPFNSSASPAYSSPEDKLSLTNCLNVYHPIQATIISHLDNCNWILNVLSVSMFDSLYSNLYRIKSNISKMQYTALLYSKHTNGFQLPLYTE